MAQGRILVKLIQVNAWCGRLCGPLARFIAKEQADIICMQEAFKPQVVNHNTFGDQYNFLEDIKTASNLAYEFFGSAWGFTLGNCIYDLGNVVLSRFPISKEVVEHTSGKYQVWNDKNPKVPNIRAYQTCAVTLPDGKSLSLLTYHGYLDGPPETGTEMTIKTMRMVQDAAHALEHPVIMSGDFNAWPSSPAIQMLDELGFTNLTVKNNVVGTLSEMHRAPNPNRQKATTDYILVSPEVIVRDFKVSEEIVSDHKALILEFEI